MYLKKTLKYHIYIRIHLRSTCWSTMWQRLQPWIFLGMMLQVWHPCISGVSPILLCRSSQALSGRMGWVASPLFSGLSRDVQSGSSPGSGWATHGHSETCPKATPKLSWLKVVVLVEGDHFPLSEVLSALEQVFIKDLSVLCSFHLSLNPD